MDGALILDKPEGLSSHSCVVKVRRLLSEPRIGHLGTLDPFATGVLPIFLGRATRLVEYHLGDPKAYLATICLGATSTTDDRDGELTPVDGSAPDRAAVETALAAMVGPSLQTPPAFSAVKLGGRRAYAMARAGETPELAPRSVTIHRLTIVDWDASDPARPIAVVEVDCSAGTYVRAIARDLGRTLGTGAYLGALVRTSSGAFQLDGAHSLDTVRAAAAEGPGPLRALLRPPDAGLDRFPRIRLTETEIAAIAKGQFVRPSAGPIGASVERVIAIDANDRPVAVATVRDGRLAPDKVLVDPPATASPAAPDTQDPEPDRVADVAPVAAS